MSKPTIGSTLARFAPALRVVLAWVGVWFCGNEFRSSPSAWHDFIAFIDRFFFRALGGFPAAQGVVRDLIHLLNTAVVPTLAVYASWTMFLVPLGFVARMVVRARVRSGEVDALERVRVWQRAHPAVYGGLLAVLPLLWTNLAFKHLYYLLDATAAEVLPVALLSGLFEYVAARGAFRAFLAPTIDPTEESRMEIGPDEIAFDAVAVTREARAAIGALAGLSFAMVVWLALLPIETLFRDPRLFAAVGAYVAIAAGTATAFRFASRVAVGVDGVLVKGTSRTRFFPYRELDDVRVVSGDIELVRKGRAVLRLQLHGADAVRRDAVTARIRGNIERVQRGEHAVAAQLVSSSSQEQLTRVASGGADYRAASLSREALWALIEGPAVDGDARRAAASALAKTSDAVERARLRVAAEHCADPKVRVALTELAEARDADADADQAPEAERARETGAAVSRG